MARHIAANALTLIIAGLVVIAILLSWSKSQFEDEGPLAEPVLFSVERGDTLNRVTARLSEAGAISNETIFRLGARYQGYDRTLKFGEYELPAGASMQAILDLISSGRGVQYRVTIPEGFTSFEAVQRLNAVAELTGEITEVPPEGTLAPDTYQFNRGEPRQAVLDRMREAQTRILAEAWAGRADDLPLNSPEELLILASIIEREAGGAEEWAKVASVFYNRLDRGMRLQADATVRYGITLGREKLGRGLRQSELTAPTLYNTYVIDGLTPTPIANPGKAAILATANPEETDFLFFVADGTGGHAFAKTLNEHNKNVAAWRRIERERAAEAKKREEEAAKAAAEAEAAAAKEDAGGATGN
ncbi:endolytic transglycosylase MltG [Oceanomicrobium pacificus]|uniref:Endolytic murein transglycosylase n=1 Tax=Oceanomicrobium pacificus TaxID=2692916 RepID=A0A6B0TXY4_9RHOB|nr:endolytic transglycosylase MltG [Oceanomicrobium pacificus]MXU66308.1 endolytic transglycosylase MltG [Oceanomicrobium pacificus]